MKPREVEGFLRGKHKLALVLAAIFFMTAVSGYFMGVRATRDFSEENRYQREQMESEGDARARWGKVPRAVSYSELHEAGLQPNAEWENAVSSLPTKAAEPLAPVAALSGRELRAVLEARQSRRQFDGAPPVVPHPITQRRAGACLLCHGDEEQPLIAGKFPPQMSHERFASCTQCHVPSGGPGDGMMQAGQGIEVRNVFRGREAPGAGSRAYEGAPPTIPHHTLMRENCSSCHGPGRVNAIRTSHPYRQSCNQCHASSAELDQRSFDLAGIREPVLFPVRTESKPKPVVEAEGGAAERGAVPGIKRGAGFKPKGKPKGTAPVQEKEGPVKPDAPDA